MHFINYFAYFIVVINSIPSLSDTSSSGVKWLCAEPTCSEPISTAKTVKNYPAADRNDKLTFSQGEEAIVLKKPKDKSDFWWVKIGDKAGIVHTSFLREKKVRVKNPIDPEVVADGADVKVTNTQKFVEVEGTRILSDDVLQSDDNDDVIVTREGDSDTELSSSRASGLAPSETTSSVEPVTTAPTVQLPENGLPHSPTVEFNKKVPSELTSDRRPSDEPVVSVTESPEFQASISPENSPENLSVPGDSVVAPKNESAPTTADAGTIEAAPTVNEAPPQFVSATMPEMDASSSNIVTKAPEHLASYTTENPGFLDSVKRDETVKDESATALNLNPVTTENPTQDTGPVSPQSSVAKSSDSPFTEKSSGIAEKVESPAADLLESSPLDNLQNDGNINVSRNALIIDDAHYSSNNSETSGAKFDAVNVSQPEAPSPSLSQDSGGVELPASSNELASSSPKESQTPQNSGEPPLQKQFMYGGLKPDSPLHSYDESPALTEPKDSPVNIDERKDSQLENQTQWFDGETGSASSQIDFKTITLYQQSQIFEETEVPKEEFEVTPTENVSQSTSAPPSSWPYEDPEKSSPALAPDVIEPLTSEPLEPPLTTETVEQPLAVEAVEQPLTTETVEQPLAVEAVEQPLTTETVDTPLALETDEQPAAEQATSPWWHPEFLDPLLESLQEYIPASLLSQSCCSQDAVNDMNEPKPSGEEQFCEKEECVGNDLTSAPLRESDTPGTSWLSYKAVFLMGFTSILVLLFTLGHYYIENLRRDVELASKYNDVSGQLFTEKREKEILEEKLEATQDMLGKVEIYENEIGRLKGQISDLNDEKAGLVKKEKEMAKKYAVLMKNYEELRRILAESRQKGERFSLVEDIKKLEENAVEYVKNIASLKEQLVDKQSEIKILNLELQKSNELKLKLEKDLEKAHLDKQDAVKSLQNSISELQKSLEENKMTHAKLEDECTRVKKDLERLKIEKELAESSLQKAHGLKSSESLSEWLEARHVRASLLESEKEVLRLSDELSTLKSSNSSLLEKESYLESEIKQLNDKYEGAEKEKIDALTRLQVLSDYFKEKETQLQEELGTKEAIWVQKQSDDDTLYEQMRALREENQRTKQVNEKLKKEIIEQEASYKKLVSTAEEKAYENWVALRHSERRLKETQMEASQLRGRLTSMEASNDVQDDKFINKSGSLDTNGELPSFGTAVSPPFMLYPGDFLPPPPLVNVGGGGSGVVPQPPPPVSVQSLTGGPRPPPVGRISSPPLDFTPPPPLVNYGMFSPPPLDSSSHVLHKPQPREPPSKRPHKDSQSSNHSDTAKDKPVQRNKR